MAQGILHGRPALTKKRIDEDLIDWIDGLDGFQRHALAEQLGIATGSMPTRPDGFDALSLGRSKPQEDALDPNAA